MAPVVRNYLGGSPIQSGEFVAEESLSEAFRHSPSDGPWILRVHDSGDSAAPYSAAGSRDAETGALNDWVLTLLDQDGVAHDFYTGIATEVRTLPACGRLFKELADGATYEEIGAADEGQRLRDRCTAHAQEHVVAAFNRVLPTEQLLYVPDSDYVGVDGLTFATVLAGASSARTARVALAVKPCREQVCTREVDTISCYNPQPDCDHADTSTFEAWAASISASAADTAASSGSSSFFRVNSFSGQGEDFLDGDGPDGADASSLSVATSALEIIELGVARQAYRSLGPGYCTSGDNSNRAVNTRIEMCYYTAGYETDGACAQLCSDDDACQAYALGTWPGSREGTAGATLNQDDDDDDIESPWDQDAYIQAGTAGWCLAYTTAACQAGGVKANEGLPGRTAVDSDDVMFGNLVDGSSGDGLFAAGGCMLKQVGTVG